MNVNDILKALGIDGIMVLEDMALKCRLFSIRSRYELEIFNLISATL
jgi:hypothetical protein